MKQFILLLWCSLVWLTNDTMAQMQHACAAAKINQQQQQMKRAVPDAHVQLMHQYDVHFYKLDIALERTSTYISGNVLIAATVVAAAMDTFGFELHSALSIDSVLVNGNSITPLRTGNAVIVPLPAGIGQGAAVQAHVFYKGTPPSSGGGGFGSGMSNDFSPSWGNQVTWSLSQPFAAHEWWPCKQVLNDKADSTEVWITTSNSNKAGSNGVLQQVVTLPGSKARYEWKSRYPISYYLVSVAVAQYVDYTITANPVGAPQPIVIQNYIYNNPQTLPNFQTDIDETADMLEAFSEKFGLYPFHEEKYGHCMAPIQGGMEHQTMTTQGFFEFTLTAQELMHQWFGNYVTCAGWQDVWLNEGFASYGEYLAYEFLRNPAQAANYMNDVHDNVKSQPGGSVYVADTTNDARIFSSRLSYDKGSTLVHTLRYLVNNDSLFYGACRAYLNQYAFGTARTANLQQVVEQYTGINLTDFVQQLFYGEGYPTYNVTYNYAAGNLYLEVLQTTSSAVTPFFSMPVTYSLGRQSRPDTIVRLVPDANISRYIIPLADAVTSITVDPDNGLVNDDNVTYDSGLSFILTGINEPVQPLLKVYPNPAADKFTIWLSDRQQPARVHITDMHGRTTATIEANRFPLHIDASRFASGVYVIHVAQTSGTQQVKWMKQ
jgi:aminopeptidase N